MADEIESDDHQMWFVAGICQQSVRQVADNVEVRAESQPQGLLSLGVRGARATSGLNTAELLGDRVNVPKMGGLLPWLSANQHCPPSCWAIWN